MDLVLFLPLVYGVITGNKALTPIFGPLHGTGFMIEVALTGWGASKGWWGGGTRPSRSSPPVLPVP